MKIKPTNYKIQVKIFELAGCKYVRTRGDHLVYRHPGAIRPVIIPKYNEIPVSKIYVVNMIGQVVKSITLDPLQSKKSQRIDLSGYANGLYVVNVSTNETSSSIYIRPIDHLIRTEKQL